MRRIFSFGGGVQSTAVLVLAAQGKVQYDEFIFSNVGDDSENPVTLEYVENYSRPFAEKHGIKFTEIRKTIHGKPVTLYEYLVGDNHSIIIPVYLDKTGVPGNRGCTVDWKVLAIAKHIRETGYREALIGLGISTDEIHRARVSPPEGEKINGIVEYKEYPLIDLGLSRADCHRIIQEAGLPVAPKSSCWFCPYHRTSTWIEMRMEQPELFDKAVELEKRLNEKRGILGKDKITLHRSCLPLDQAIGLQDNFFNEFDFCESGYCMV